MTYIRGDYLFATHDDPQGISEAKEFMNEKGIDFDVVRIMRKEGQILIQAKQTLEIHT